MQETLNTSLTFQGVQSNGTRRNSVMYNVDTPMEMTVGQEINNALRDGDQLSEAVYSYDKTQSDNNLENNLNSENKYLAAQTDASNQQPDDSVFTTDKQTARGNSQSYFIAPSEDYSLKSENLIDLQKKLGIQKDDDYNTNHENEAIISGDDDVVDTEATKEKDTENNNDKDDTSSDEDSEDSGDELPVDSLSNKNVNKSRNDKETTIQEDIQSVINEVKANANSALPSRLHKDKHRHMRHHHKARFNDNIPNLKEKKKLFENVEFEMNRRIKEEEHSLLKKEKERQKGTNIY